MGDGGGDGGCGGGGGGCCCCCGVMTVPWLDGGEKGRRLVVSGYW